MTQGKLGGVEECLCYQQGHMCLNLTFCVQLANFVILRMWYHFKELCLKITVSNKELQNPNIYVNITTLNYIPIKAS